MHGMRWTLALLPLLAGCGRGSQGTVGAVQAATRAATETTAELSRAIIALAHSTPDAVQRELQGLLDAAARELKEVQDSETARRIADDVQRALVELGRLGQRIGEKLDLADLQRNVEHLIQRFADDPRVVGALKALFGSCGSCSG